MTSKHTRRPLRTAFAVLGALVACTVIAMAAPQKRPQLQAPRLQAVPTIPKASRLAGNRVILERAEKLHKTEWDSFMVVSGNVEFSKGPMLMFCDSAHYSPSDGSLDAFGNVRMEQGDTLFVYADELNYSGTNEIAYLYGYDPARPVRMINRDVKLETDVFTYDMLYEIGFYNTWGVLTDRQNRLTSTQGEYIPATKDANFYTNVVLTSLERNDTLRIYTDTLFYNTDTHIAHLNSPTEIINGDGHIITTDGVYNTENSLAELYAHSRVYTRGGTTLEGDTLIYDRNTGIGEAFGNMALVDSVRQSSLHGDYGFYNELIDSAFVTGHALAKEYSRGDTLYMHGRYIKSIAVYDTVCIADTISPAECRTDTTHIMTAWPRVRFYRSDMQGICDTMVFVQRDSTLNLRHNPVVWSDDRQIFGNVITLFLNDSTIERAHLPEQAFVAQEIEQPFYNQLSGKEMMAYFDGGELSRLDVSGNVEAIFFPEEEDSTINKMVTLTSSFLTGWFKDRKLLRMKTWPASNGTVTPLYLARRADITLPKFEWYAGLRPTSPASVFVIPAEMEILMGGSPEPDTSSDPPSGASEAILPAEESE